MLLQKDIVTILVLVYNSEKTIIETLESIKNQTYPHLNLVITDDASVDKSVSLCKRWMDKNASRFVSATILESDINRGTSANFNRGEQACSTRWIKPIAGDDLLLPDCIQKNVDYMNQHPDVVLLFSQQQAFINDTFLPIKEYDKDFFELTSQEQVKRLVYDSTILDAPTFFYNNEVTRESGLFCDERIPLIEDLPKWINAARLNLKFGFLSELTVLYRLRRTNLYAPKDKSPQFYYSERLLFFFYLYEERIKYDREREIESVAKEESRFFKSYTRYRNFWLFRFLRMAVGFIQHLRYS